jgi:hypothetical protein
LQNILQKSEDTRTISRTIFYYRLSPASLNRSFVKNKESLKNRYLRRL